MKIYKNFCSALNPGKKFVVLFGVPGSGKGTYANLLSKDTGFLKLSTGDELRKLTNLTPSAQNSELHKKITQQIDNGQLTDDDIVFKILEGKVLEANEGIILDGFPRNITQLEKFNEKYSISLVINCILDEEILIEKLLGRRTCLNCGKAYNICTILKRGYDMPAILPKKEGVCDLCQGKLVSRSDDTEEIIKRRMKIYNQNTEILLKYYKKLNLVVDFIPKRGVNDYPEFYNRVIKPRL